MRDLAIHDNDLIVATHGRAFWVLDDITPLRQMQGAVQSAPAFLFRPAPAWRIRRDTNTDTPLPPDEPAGKNPPDGAVIDYVLGQTLHAPVTLEILDKDGNVVRRWSSADAPENTPEELEKQLIPLYWLRRPHTLSAQPGMHRWVWDLHATAPVSTQRSYPIAAVPHDTPQVPQGPLALPGTYTVRLTVDGKHYTAPLTVKMDPRVHAGPSALAAQYAAETRLAASLTATSNALLEARSMQQQLGAVPAASAAYKTAQDALKGISAILEGTGPKTPQAPAMPGLERTNGRLGTLYGEIGMADSAPTAAEQQATSATLRDAATGMQRWSAWKQTTLPLLDQALRSAGLKEIDPTAKAAITLGAGDED